MTFDNPTPHGRASAALGLPLFLIILALAAPPTAAQEVTVRFASAGGSSDGGLLLAEELGFFKEASLRVVMQRMPNPPTLMTALATDQMDAAGILITPGLFTAVQQGIEIRIVGDKQSLTDGFAAVQLIVQPDLVKASNEETIRALKGRTVAVTSKASAGYLQLKNILADEGIGLGDIKTPEISLANMTAAMSSRAVDGVVAIEFFSSQMIKAGVGKPVSDMRDRRQRAARARTVAVPLVYSERFAAKRETAQAFMTAYVKGVRVYNDAFVKGKDKDRVIEIIARRAKLDPNLVRQANPSGLDPNQKVDVEGLEACQRFFIEQGFMRAPVDLAKVVDTSFAAAAVRQLGEYK
jgi:NitT/TauT family transport system substrate-binding protein